MSPRTALSCLLLALLGLAAGAWAENEAPPKPADCSAEPAKLPDVALVSELFEQPAIDIGEGRTVRLGIEAHRVAPGTPVIIYALVEGPCNPKYEAAAVEHAVPLGYLYVKIEAKGTLPYLPPWSSNTVRPHFDVHPGARLFAVPVFAPEKGSYTLRVLDAKGRALASAEVAASDAAVHPWLALEPDEDGNDDLERNIKVKLRPRNNLFWPIWKIDQAFSVKKSQDASLPSLSPPDGLEDAAHAAAPDEKTRAEIEASLKQLGSEDFYERQAASTKLKKLRACVLPILQKRMQETSELDLKSQLKAIMDALAPRFRIARNKSGVRVSLPDNLTLNLPHKNFLVRLWINGNPFAPPVTEDEMMGMAVKSMRTVREFNFLLRLDQKSFDIHKGDKVAMQMLCAPDETRSHQSQVMDASQGESDDKLLWPLLSNRIEFVAP